MTLHPYAGWALGGIFTLLTMATLAVSLIQRRRQLPQGNELALRVRSWWIMVSFFSLAIVMGSTAATWLLGFVSFLAFKEYLSLIPTRRSDRRV
ncbi:MAG: phosphatidate cytidylyltransferase, partial [Chromatiales bacterium]|nr:phosphatidate cytidylyltransferase [Chromatiales bacterium]